MLIPSTKLVSIGSFDLKLNHLLIIGVLALSFSVSFLLRAQPAGFGFELGEFDPFFNYRATQYIVDNGIDAYFEWDDDLSWYPTGRNISANAQVVLHLSAAITYWIFGGEMDLYDFTIMFPIFFGSISAIVIFALVRVIGGTTAGLFAAMFFSISLPILIRGPIGWFKSEPFGLFLSLLAIYFLLSAISSTNKKITLMKLASAGIFTTLSISAWGGNQFFIIPLGIFFIALPFLRNDHKFLIWAIPVYTVAVLLPSLGFERVTSGFLFGLTGLGLVTSTLIMVSCILIQSKSGKHKTRNGLLFLGGIMIVISGIVALDSSLEILPSASHRYLNAINPFLTTTDPLADSVSEHATTTLAQSFLFHSVLMIFSSLGIWIIFKNIRNETLNFLKKDMAFFALILGIMGVYVSSTFIRLEIFASVALIVLASLGLSGLIKEFFKKPVKSKKSLSKILQLSFTAGIVLLLITPMVYPVGSDIPTLTKVPPTILNGGTSYAIATNDWLDTLDWIKNNTPEDAIVAAWWDYGYWLSTMAERTTLADNFTVSTIVIVDLARIYLDNPDSAWSRLVELEADYVLVFVAGERLGLDSDEPLYGLGGGGDESKKHWLVKIAGLDSEKYLHLDGSSATEYFWDETLLGQLFPFSVLGYVNPADLSQQSKTYNPGMTPIYEKNIAYPSDNDDGPFKLAYSSSSFNDERVGPLLGVFVYEINKDYKPQS